ncbi:MAG: polyphenol oxidase family protein [Bifidobacteriaceae bacterium]|nr:polyphenol oxidase family protein [Bifidobacteriaceae bacterium]
MIQVDLAPGVEAWFTASEFDLATRGGREDLATHLGYPLVFANQVHGQDLAWVTPETLRHAPAPDAFPTADALATEVGGIGLVVRTADCVPLLLADPDRGLVAAVHVGWRGLLAGVAGAALEELRARGAGQLRAAVGPAICGDCYQVGQDVAKAAQRQGHVTTKGTDGIDRLDVAGSVVRQLRQAGLAPVSRVEECTAESSRLFSWRSGRATGRQGGVIALAGSHYGRPQHALATRRAECGQLAGGAA